MRIGVDMLGVQDAGGRGRGIGRYVQQFLDALVRSDPADEYLLYQFDRLGPPPVPRARAQTRVVPSGRGPLVDAAQGIVDRNPDSLDLYLVTSPFSWTEGYRPPVKPVGRLRVASVLYDLIPMVTDLPFYLDDLPGRRADYFERVARLRDYDLILAISEATRADAVRRIGVPGRRVVNISSATREGFFGPPLSPELPGTLAALGVRQPYLLGVASTEPHKNTDGLVRAFARLPDGVRAAHQLVLVGALAEEAAEDLAAYAARRGVGDRLVLVGRLSDERLREAYQHCAAFAFPSHYEGFGLPLLEAMLCGAPVVAGAHSSQVEVVADAGLTADTRDDSDLADKLRLVLTDAALAARLRRRAPEQARTFGWARTARRARHAFGALPPPRLGKPLLAFFAPLPPRRGVASEHALALLHELRRHFTIHLYHERGRAPHVALADPDLPAFEDGLFERHDRVWNYHAALYQMDESGRPDHVREAFLRRPGVVLIHPGGRAAGGVCPQVFARALQVIVPDAGTADRLGRACGGRVRVVPTGSPGERYADALRPVAAAA